MLTCSGDIKTVWLCDMWEVDANKDLHLWRNSKKVFTLGEEDYIIKLLIETTPRKKKENYERLDYRL